MYVFEYQQPKTLEVLCITLTDDWMSPHALEDDRRIAADKHRQGRNVSPSTTLGDFVHLSAVDGPILALVSDGVHLLELCILPTLEPGVEQQLLDCII